MAPKSLSNIHYLLHWERLWTAHPKPPTSYHPGFCKPESKKPLWWSLPEPEPTQPEADYHMCFGCFFFQGIREFTKMFLLPRVSAHPCGKISALTHWLDTEHAEHNSHLKLGVGHWSQIFNCQSVSAELLSSWCSAKDQRLCFTWCIKLGILKLSSPHYLGAVSSF